jgi:hypothetical protein
MRAAAVIAREVLMYHPLPPTIPSLLCAQRFQLITLFQVRWLPRSPRHFYRRHRQSCPRVRSLVVACIARRAHSLRRSYMIDKGVYPSPLGYCGFPKSICTSVNNVDFVFAYQAMTARSPSARQVICHGIPDDRVLLDGDVVKIDVSVCVPLRESNIKHRCSC